MYIFNTNIYILIYKFVKNLEIFNLKQKQKKKKTINSVDTFEGFSLTKIINYIYIYFLRILTKKKIKFKHFILVHK